MALQDKLINILQDSGYVHKDVMINQIIHTKHPAKYVDVVERLTGKTVTPAPAPTLIPHEQLLSSIVQPLMLRMIQSQLMGILNEDRDDYGDHDRDGDRDDDRASNRDNDYEHKDFKYGSLIREKSCCICSVDFTADDSVILRKCEHMFHKSCLSQWEKSGNANAKKCPTCRSD